MFNQFKILAVIALIALTLNACQPIARPAANETTGEATLPQIVVQAHDFAFDLPDQIEAGLVKIVLENHGMEPHHLQLARLNDGVTPEQFVATLEQGPEEAAMTMITFPGGVGPIDPTGRQEAIVELTPGTYVVLCFIPSPDGVPHLAKGMLDFVEVVAGEMTSTAAQPAVDGEVKLLDYSFALPAEIKAGPQVWKIVNEGTEVHEINLIKLAEDKTMEDVMHFMMHPDGAPPFTNVGGFQAIDPGKSGYLPLDLTPGDYIAICHVPSPKNEDKAHEELGMVLPFSVKN
jgi:hypothetical protein